jgi:hypothetical protein
MHFKNFSAYHIVGQNQNLYQLKRWLCLGVGMDLIMVVEYLQSLLILGIFLFILAVGFKVWRWNYVVPPR